MNIRETMQTVGEVLWGEDWENHMAQALHIHETTLTAIYHGREKFHDENRAMGDLLRLVQTEVLAAIDAREKAHQYYVDRRERALWLQDLAQRLSDGAL